jgi:hypothetical protein
MASRKRLLSSWRGASIVVVVVLEVVIVINCGGCCGQILGGLDTMLLRRDKPTKKHVQHGSMDTLVIGIVIFHRATLVRLQSVIIPISNKDT